MVQAILGEGRGLLPPTIGERLKRHRQQLGMTIEAMARELYVAPSSVCRWESGEREPQGEYRGRLEKTVPG